MTPYPIKPGLDTHLSRSKRTDFKSERNVKENIENYWQSNKL